MTKIIDNLYIGSLEEAESKFYDVIMNLSNKILKPKNSETILIDIPMIDDEEFPICNYFDYTYCIIDTALKKKQKIIINCRAGISRSVTVVCSYLMSKFDMDFFEAMELISKKRKIADPNSGFVQQLLEQ